MTEPLCLTSPQWNGKDPGAYAVVIGISRYDHLPDGPGPTAPDTYGMSQLCVSALTAYRLFEWLRDGYVCDRVPLAKCWLLLSPTDEEIEQVPGLDRYPRASFANCRTAIGQWFSEMRDLDCDTAHTCRSLFFFSGHGLELHQDEQLLLLCDVLAPPLNRLEQSLRTQNLRRGMSRLTVPGQLFFVDACRNDHPQLREQGLQLRGADVLDEYGTTWNNPDIAAPIIYATAAGAQAYQPNEVGKGKSLYGQALLEGVSSPPADIRTTEQGICQVDLYRLTSYLNRRIAELLTTEYQVPVSQQVTIGGTMKPPPLVTNDVDDTASMHQMPPPSGLSPQLAARHTRTLHTSDWGQLVGGTEAVDVFGSSAVAELWGSHTLRTDAGEPVSHHLESVTKYAPGICRLLLRLADARTAVVWNAQVQSEELSCRIPVLGPDALVRLDVDSGHRVSVSVDEGSPGYVGEAASTWRMFTEGHVTTALAETDPLVRHVIDGDIPTPFPALVAALVRLRAAPQASVDFVKTLCVLFPSWPDFPVLLNELRLRTTQVDDIPTCAANTFTEGFVLPFSAEALGYAATHAAAADSSADPTALAVVRQAVIALQPGGFFCTTRQA